MKHLLVGLSAFVVSLSGGSSLWSQGLLEPAGTAERGSANGLPAAASNTLTSLRIHNADSSAILTFRFAGQLRTDWESEDGLPERGRTSMITMQARRIRPSMTVEFPRRRIQFRLHLSTAPQSLELMDMYFDWRTNNKMHLRIGQYKLPFTRYRIQSFQRLTFVDWAVVTRYFGAERQMGFAFHNGYERPPRIAYVLGVFSGVNARASHAVGLSGIYGEVASNPSELSDPDPRGDFHPELAGHLSYNTGGIQVQSDSDEKRGGWRGSTGVSMAWDLDPVDYHDLALRVAPELLFKYHGMSFMMAGYAGFAEAGSSQHIRLAMSGLLVQTSLRLSGRYELSLRYAMVDFDEAVLDAAVTRAQQLISEAEAKLADSILSRSEVDELRMQYKGAGQVVREQELTVGFNLYVIGHSLKCQSDIGWLRHMLRDNERRDDIIWRSQLQVGF